MEEVIILGNGKAYKRSAFDSVNFYKKGWVIGFKLNGIDYVTLYKGKEGPFSNFIKAKEFYENRHLKGKERKVALTPHYLYDSSLVEHLAKPEDIVYIQIRKVRITTDGTYQLCKELKRWPYSGELYNTSSSLSTPVISPPIGVEAISELEDCLYLTDEARGIYDMAKKRADDFSGNLVWEIPVVEDVVELLSKLKPDVTEALTNIGMIQLYDNETSYWSQESDTGYYHYTNQQLIQYRDYLVAFTKWYTVNKERFQTESDVDKLYWLVSYFDFRVLTTIPYQDKIKVLDKFLTENIDERVITSLSLLREPLVLKLFRSINDDEASEFLEALLEKPKVILPNGQQKDLDVYDQSIRLRALYKAIDDKRFTVFGKDNRKRFVELIVQLWKKSKYSFYDHNQSDINDQNLDTTSYFNNEGLRYFINDGNPYSYIQDEEIEHIGEPVLEIGDFGTWYDEQNQIVSLGGLTFNFSQKYTSGKDEDFKNEIITIHQEKGYTPVYGDAVFDFIELQPTFFRNNRNHKLKYHVYQPIKFIQYEDEGDRILSLETIPALSFFYEQEYEELKELDAAIVLAAEISLEVLFFAVSGGASSLAQIRHLKHVTNLGRRLLTTGEAIKVWRGVEVTLEALSFSSGVISSTFNFLATTADVNSPEYEKYKDLRGFFGILALTSGIGAAGARTIATKKAIKLVNKMDVDGVVFNIDPELENIIRTIGNADIFKAQMRSNLLFLQETHGFPNLVNRFDDLTELKKYAFYEDFHKLKDLNAWRLFNDSTEAFNNWVNLKNLDFPDTKLLSVITNQNRANGFIRYFEEDVSKTILLRNYSQEQRIAFIDEFGDIDAPIFSNFNNNPYGIELAMQGIYPIGVSGDVLSLDQIKDILRTTFAANEFDVLGFISMKNSIRWSDVEPSFLNVIDEFIPMTKTELASFRSEFSEFVENNPAAKKLFFGSNRLRVTTKRFQDDEFLGEDIELFISGNKDKVDPVLDNFPPFIKNKFVEPLNDELYYEVFNRASIDVTKGVPRFDDTEVKYIYNYLINHIDSGNRVIIEIESVLYTCASCRKYLIALKKYAETQNIDLTIISRAHPEAYENKDVIRIINE